MNATARDLRFHTGALLETAMQGEDVVITYRGQPRARLVGIRCKRSASHACGPDAFGIWADNPQVADVEAFVRKLRAGRTL